MSFEINPWVSRFEHLTREFIGKNLANNPDELDEFDEYAIDEASHHLEKKFREVFVPSEQIINFVEILVNVAKAHALSYYPDKNIFIQNCYDDKYKIAGECFGYFLTGFAGSGKSALLNAIARVFPKKRYIKMEGYSDYPLNSFSSYKIPGNVGMSSILKGLLGSDVDKLNKRKNTLGDILDLIVWKFYREGVPFLTLDEFQFISRSENANAKIANLLGWISSIGVPYLISANYSLGHRLRKRPQEDQQRFMSKPLVLLPDKPESEDWRNTVEAYRQVCPKVFTFDSDRDAADIHGWTMGNKRILSRFLVLAYEQARKSGANADIVQLEQTYKSIGFAQNRKDVQDMMKVIVLNNVSRADLVCPFEQEKNAIDELRKSIIEKRKLQVVAEMAESSLSANELAALKIIKKMDQKRKPVKSGKDKASDYERKIQALKDDEKFI